MCLIGSGTVDLMSSLSTSALAALGPVGDTTHLRIRGTSLRNGGWYGPDPVR